MRYARAGRADHFAVTSKLEAFVLLDPAARALARVGKYSLVHEEARPRARPAHSARTRCGVRGTRRPGAAAIASAQQRSVLLFDGAFVFARAAAA